MMILLEGVFFMKQSKFDIVMDYIDESINLDPDTIKSGILNLIGINSERFGHFFNVLTGDTLGNYIRNRRLYFAVNDLRKRHDKSISDIAYDYGYSDQSAFTRAITTKYNMSPLEIRFSRGTEIQNEKYHFSDFDPNASDMRTDRIWREFDRTGYLSPYDLDYLEEIQRGHREYHFDIDTCYAIADLAERLEIPVTALMDSCFELATEIKSAPDYVDPRTETVVQLGLASEEELDAICSHYNCKHYELTMGMVIEYYDIDI